MEPGQPRGPAENLATHLPALLSMQEEKGALPPLFSVECKITGGQVEPIGVSHTHATHVSGCLTVCEAGFETWHIRIPT